MNRSLFALVGVLLLPLAALAHGMGMDVKVKGGTVSMAVYYDDDTPGAGAKVKVFNAAKEVILEGTTDDQGGWSFPAPPPGEYTVRAKTDDGHAAKGAFTISADPVPAEAPPTDTPSRADFTGPRRFIMLGGGLLVLCTLFAGWYWISRRNRSPGSSVE